MVHIISSRLDYCNSLYMAVCNQLNQSSQYKTQLTVDQIQSERPHHPVLASLHWLPVRYRIYFKVLLFVFKALNGQPPSYISDLLSPYPNTRSLRSADQRLLTVRGLTLSSGGAVPLLSQPLNGGTASPLPLGLPPRQMPSSLDSKPTSTC